MSAKTGYMLLGSGILAAGITPILSTGSTGSGAANAGLGCLAGLLAFVGLGLIVAGDIVIFVKRRDLSPRGKRGAVAGLIGAIGMGVLFIVAMIISLLMVADMMSTAMAGGAEESPEIILDDILHWTLILSVVGIFSAVAQVFAEGGPCFWADKKPAQIISLIGGILVVLLTVVSVMISQSIIDDVRKEYGDTDLSDEEVMADMQKDLNPGSLYAIRALTSIGHFMMGAAAFIVGSGLTGSKPVTNPMEPLSPYPPYQGISGFGTPVSEQNKKICASCGQAIDEYVTMCPFCQQPSSGNQPPGTY